MSNDMYEKEGGSAFPLFMDHPSAGPAYEWGMSLRDYFAAKAMQGAFSSPVPASTCEKEYIAHHAYAMADAMLEARK